MWVYRITWENWDAKNTWKHMLISWIVTVHTLIKYSPSSWSDLNTSNNGTSLPVSMLHLNQTYLHIPILFSLGEELSQLNFNPSIIPELGIFGISLCRLPSRLNTIKRPLEASIKHFFPVPFSDIKLYNNREASKCILDPNKWKNGHVEF